MSSVWSGQTQIGWGCICGLHNNPGDSGKDKCNKHMTYGKDQFGDQAIRLQPKRWLHRGIRMSDEDLGNTPPRAPH